MRVGLCRENRTDSINSAVIEKSAQIMTEHAGTGTFVIEGIVLRPFGELVPQTLLVAGVQVVAQDQQEVLRVLAGGFILPIMPTDELQQRQCG